MSLHLYLIETADATVVVCCPEESIKRVCAEVRAVRFGLLGLAHEKTPAGVVVDTNGRVNANLWNNIISGEWLEALIRKHEEVRQKATRWAGHTSKMAEEAQQRATSSKRRFNLR